MTNKKKLLMGLDSPLSRQSFIIEIVLAYEKQHDCHIPLPQKEKITQLINRLSYDEMCDVDLRRWIPKDPKKLSAIGLFSLSNENDPNYKVPLVLADGTIGTATVKCLINGSALLLHNDLKYSKDIRLHDVITVVCYPS